MTTTTSHTCSNQPVENISDTLDPVSVVSYLRQAFLLCRIQLCEDLTILFVFILGDNIINNVYKYKKRYVRKNWTMSYTST